MGQSAPDGQGGFARQYAAMLHKLGVDPELYAPGPDSPAPGAPLGMLHNESGWWVCWPPDGQAKCCQQYASLDDALYSLARYVVSQEGASLRRTSGRPGLDPRRAEFACQLELIGRVSCEWQQRLAQELAGRLVRHPYRDVVDETRAASQPDPGMSRPAGLAGSG
jgi:hypothetical protein